MYLYDNHISYVPNYTYLVRSYVSMPQFPKTLHLPILLNLNVVKAVLFWLKKSYEVLIYEVLRSC